MQTAKLFIYHSLTTSLSVLNYLNYKCNSIQSPCILYYFYIAKNNGIQSPLYPLLFSHCKNKGIQPYLYPLLFSHRKKTRASTALVSLISLFNYYKYENLNTATPYGASGNANEYSLPSHSTFFGVYDFGISVSHPPNFGSSLSSTNLKLFLTGTPTL